MYRLNNLRVLENVQTVGLRPMFKCLRMEKLRRLVQLRVVTARGDLVRNVESVELEYHHESFVMGVTQAPL